MIAEAHTLIGAYVLDAVTDFERAAVDRHLRDCETCRSDVDELREASAKLADGAWSVPPPRLRDNVLAAIATTRQVAPISPAAPAAVPVVRRSRLRLVSAAAAVVVAAAGAATAVYVVQDQRVQKANETLAAAQADESLTRAVLGSRDLVVKEEQLTGGGRVTVAYSKLQDAGVVTLAANSAPAGSKILQLWTIRGQDATPQGTMSPGQTSTMQLVRGLPEANAVGVTVESGPHAAEPTLPLVGKVNVA